MLFIIKLNVQCYKRLFGNTFAENLIFLPLYFYFVAHFFLLNDYRTRSNSLQEVALSHKGKVILIVIYVTSD
jgi:hypothetical protein